MTPLVLNSVCAFRPTKIAREVRHKSGAEIREQSISTSQSHAIPSSTADNTRKSAYGGWSEDDLDWVTERYGEMPENESPESANFNTGSSIAGVSVSLQFSIASDVLKSPDSQDEKADSVEASLWGQFGGNLQISANSFLRCRFSINTIPLSSQVGWIPSSNELIHLTCTG